MSTRTPRKGSLQFWPRKRARKFLPRVNWGAIDSEKNLKGLKGFICYKAGMASAYVKDNTEHSMTKGKKIVLPVTILECPTMKIFSVRFYKDGIPAKEILSENLDKEMRRKVIMAKGKHGKVDSVKREEYDDIKVICYSQVKKTNIKKTPDLSEIGLTGSLDEKLEFVKENLGKEISISSVFKGGQLVDFRGLTTGRGLSGPVKRFGITLKSHKSEKGVRRPGSLGPWHPARTTFRAPMAGQYGMFTRVSYNNTIVDMGKSEGKKGLSNIHNFGDLKTDYILVKGSVQGPPKRQLVATFPLRETKKQGKKKFEFIELR
ncbi:MAG: 50S ribosomal protein L3 [Nanoarchaeota archaeon]